MSHGNNAKVAVRADAMLDTFVSGADLSAKAGRAVYIDASAGTAKLAVTPASHNPRGLVVEAAGGSGYEVSVCFKGLCPGVLGGTVAPGDALTFDAAGDLIKTTTDNDYCVGYATEIGVDNDLIMVDVQPFMYGTI